MQGNGDQRAAFWRERFREYQGSGLTQAAFSDRKQLSRSTVGYWFRKISKLEEVSGLVEVKKSVVSSAGKPACSVRVVVGEYRIEVEKGFDAEVLREVVRTLESMRG